MSGLNAKKVEGGGGFKQPVLDAGTYPARLVQVLGLGTQKQRPYQGQEKDPVMEISTSYELLDEFIVDEEGNVDETKPRWLSETMPFHNLEADRAKSTKRYYAMDADDEHDGDWKKLLGSPVMITITKTEGKNKNAGKFFNNIAGVSAMRPKEAAKAEELKNEPRLFDFYDPDIDVFMSLPKWLQDKMKEATDFEGSDLEDAIRNYKAPEDEKSNDKADKEQVADKDTDTDEDGEW